MLSCKQVASQAGDITQHRLPTWQQRFAVWLHLMICHHCRRYLRQTRLMQALMRQRHQRLLDDETTTAVIEAVQAAHNDNDNGNGNGNGNGNTDA